MSAALLKMRTVEEIERLEIMIREETSGEAQEDILISLDKIKQSLNLL